MSKYVLVDWTTLKCDSGAVIDLSETDWTGQGAFQDAIFWGDTDEPTAAGRGREAGASSTNLDISAGR